MNDDLMNYPSASQSEIIDAPSEGTLVVFGSPGTGKTHALVERAKRLSRAGDRILFLSAFKASAADIAKRLSVPGPGGATLDATTVMTPLQLALKIARLQGPVQLLARSQWEQMVEEVLRGEFGDDLPADYSFLRRFLDDRHSATPSEWPEALTQRVREARTRLLHQLRQSNTWPDTILFEAVHDAIAQGWAPTWAHIFVDAFGLIPGDILQVLPQLAKVGLTLADDLLRLPSKTDLGFSSDNFSHSLGKLPHIPPLRVLRLSNPAVRPVVELEILREPDRLLARTLQFLEEQLLQSDKPKRLLVVVESVKTRQDLTPGVDAWQDLHGKQLSAQGTEVDVVTWSGSQGLEADAAVVSLMRPPAATFSGTPLYVALSRARRVVRLLLAAEVASAWVEQLRQLGVIYREVGDVSS